nr:MAG TPA: hypothetical protein [Caudoviricetes sp.]
MCLNVKNAVNHKIIHLKVWYYKNYSYICNIKLKQ